MIGWLAWVGSALVLLSLVFDDRRALRLVNLVAALMMLVIGLALGSAQMAAFDALLVAAAVRENLRTHSSTLRRPA